MKNRPCRRYTDTLRHKISYVVAIFLLLTYFAMATIKISPQNENMSLKSNNKQEIEAIISELAPQYGLDPELVKAIVQVESQWKATARSKKGAIGLMQVMPEVCQLYVKPLNLSAEEARKLLYLERFNLHIGMAHLKALQARWGDKALDIYSGGARNYVSKIRLAMRKEER